MMKKKVYKITVSDVATYVIKTNSLERGEDLAVEWFSEREPKVVVEETDEEPDVEI